MRRKETLADLTENMQTALIHCHSRGVKPHEFEPGGRWPASTLEALKAHDLVHLTINRKKRDVYRPTDSGRSVLMAHVPLFLHRDPARNYTHTLRNAAWREPEAA